MKPTEILLKVFLPYNKPLEYVREFKQAHRRDDDIAIANAGMRVSFSQTSDGTRLPAFTSRLALMLLYLFTQLETLVIFSDTTFLMRVSACEVVWLRCSSE